MSKHSYIEKTAKESGATVLYCNKATTLSIIESSKKSQKNKRKIKYDSFKKILLITDCYIEQYDIDYNKTKDKAPEKKAFWFDLVKINVNTESNFFSLEFAYPEPTESDIKNEIDPQNYIFELTNQKGDLVKFYAVIIQLIQRILTAQEMRDLVFFDDENLYNDDAYFEKCNFTPRGAFARFLILNMKKKNGDLSQNVKESVAEYLLMKYNNVFIRNEFCIENCLDIFLSALKPLQYIESISIPTFNNYIQVDSLNILANFLKKASNIQHFEIHGPCSKSHFHDLCRSIENMGVIDNENKGKRKSQCKLTGITFDNFELNTKQVASIKTAAISARLLSLGINNIRPVSNANSKPEENDTIIDYIVDTLLSPHLTSSLQLLSLDGNHDIDIQKLFENSGSIQKVSLKNCGLEITYVFEALASIKTSIDSIDLSGNSCNNSDIDKALTSLPNPLLRIDVNNVAWSDDCLVNFLRGIVKIYELEEDELDEEEEDKSEEGSPPSNLKDTLLNSEENVNSGLNSILVTLSMSHIQTSKSEWQNVRTFFEDNRKKVRIEQFSYNGNKISSHFIIFLRNMKKLKRLFLNNCPNFSQYSSILATNFITKSSTLSELYIERADSSSFPEDSSFSTFFKKCCDSISLRLLDAKMCNIGVDGLTSLSNLITKCKSGNLNQIAFDGTGCESLEDINEFVSTCRSFLDDTNNKRKSSKSHKRRKNSSKSNRSYRRIFVELPSYDLKKMKVREIDVEKLKSDLYDLTISPDDQDELWTPPFEFWVMQKNDEFPKYFHPTMAAKMRKKIDKNLEIERSLRKSGNSSYQQRPAKEPQFDTQSFSTNTSSGVIGRNLKMPKGNRSNLAKSYRNDGFEDDRNRKRGFLYVGNRSVTDSENDDDDDLNETDRRNRNKGMQHGKRVEMVKSKYDEDDDDDDVDVGGGDDVERGRRSSGSKRKSNFKFNDWEFPVRSLDNVDELNEGLFIKLQDRFSLNQLIAEASTKND